MVHRHRGVISLLKETEQKPGLPRWHSGKEFAWRCRRHKKHGFNPWVGKMLWRRKWQPIPVFLPGESHGQRSLAVHRVAKSQTQLKRLSMIFPVVMYRCESLTIEKAAKKRIDTLELWCWRRLLRVPWTARRSNQSILKEINPEYSLEGLMVKLKLQ